MMPASLVRLRGLLYAHLGLAAGLAAGAFGGFFALLAGGVIGALTDELRSQARTDRAIARYLEYPGKANFLEPSPGLAAYCALGTLLAEGRAPYPDQGAGGIALGATVARNARRIFRLAEKDIPALDAYCRLAAEAGTGLNADLLAESLAARRGPLGDLPYLCEGLEELALGAGAEEEARRIRRILVPGVPRTPMPAAAAHDPWAILGLNRDAARDEIKSTFRKLAVQFHPDSVRDLREDQQRQAAEAFMRIQNAYKQILSTRRPGVS